jgi:tetratricopeptide (TPR) repeat protein
MIIIPAARSKLLLALLAFGLWHASASAEDGRALYKTTIRGTALVNVRFGDNSRSQGTCWVVDRKRMLLVTNHHVVRSAELVNVIFPAYADDKARKNGSPLSSKDDYQGKLGLTGRVLDTDPERDLAIIQLEILPEGTEELKLAAESAGPGDRVHSIGNPAASDALWVHAEGGVRAVYRKRWSERIGNGTVACHAWILETQAPLNPGDSGGPMVNERGEVVAVVSCGSPALVNGRAVQNVNWGIDVREVRAFVDQTTRLLTPKTAADYVLRGERRLNRRQDDQARKDFDAALRLDSSNARAYRFRGALLRLRGDRDTALADLNRAIELDGRSAETYLERGLVYFEKGKDFWDRAEADDTKAIQLNPAFSAAFNNRGLIHAARGDLGRALADYTQAIEKDPQNAVPYTNRGNIHYRQRAYKEALADYGRALQIAPTGPRMKQAAIICIDVNDPRRAVLLTQEVIKHFPADADAVTYRVQALGYQQLHEPAAAIASYGEAIRRDQTHAWTYFQRGRLYEEQNDVRALADYEKAVQLDAKWAKELKTYGRRTVTVVNHTGEALRVHLYYETLTTEQKWYWYPEPPPAGKPLTVTVEPGKAVLVRDEDGPIHGRRMRIWAEGATSGTEIATHKDKDVMLCAREYRAAKMMTFTYTFGAAVKK